MRAGKLAAGLAVGMVFFVMAASASADSVQVTSGGDTGTSTCTFRNALTAINDELSEDGCTYVTAAGNDQITFAPSVTSITLVGSQLQLSDINRALDVVGPGMGSLTITAASNARVFNHPSGPNAVTVSGMTLTGGNPTPAAGFAEGGCVFNDGTLTLDSVRVTNCTASISAATGDLFADGGGITSNGSLTLANSIVDHNHASSSNTGTANQAASRGAGIFAQGSGLTINNSTISSNDATATTAGGNFADAEGGIEVGLSGFTISHSTLAGNTAHATQVSGVPISAGALTVTGGPGTVELSTIAGNTADASPVSAFSIAAGGIYMELATTALRSSTVAFNGPTSGAFDGANLTVDDTGTLNVHNSIVSNPLGGGKNCAIPSGTLSSGGFNDDFSSAGASCFTSPMATDLTADPMLLPLGSNGGPTATMGLQPTSPVIDKGSNAGDTDTSHDQRGLTRPVDFSGLPNAANGTDIGAFELEAACAEQLAATPLTTCPTGGGGGGGTTSFSTPPAGVTGQRAARKKHCRKKFKDDKAKRKKCLRKANRLPV